MTVFLWSYALYFFQQFGPEYFLMPIEYPPTHRLPRRTRPAPERRPSASPAPAPRLTPAPHHACHIILNSAL